MFANTVLKVRGDAAISFYLVSTEFWIYLYLPTRTFCAPLLLPMVGRGIGFAPLCFQAKFLCVGRRKVGLGSAHLCCLLECTLTPVAGQHRSWCHSLLSISVRVSSLRRRISVLSLTVKIRKLWCFYSLAGMEAGA